jgi:filamentous hemagglutinin family protein
MQTKTKLLGLCLAVVSTNLFALPQISPNHVPDGASINPAQSNAAHLHIDQTTPRAILNWHQFNITPKESVHFQQPANGFILNRVNPAQGASQIAGKISANGNVIISNAAGIHFGPTARVDVAGLIATTANITDANFKAGNYQFKDDTGLGFVTNEGVISSNAAEHGFVALLAPNVRNKGKITATLGKIGLYSSKEFVMSFDNNNLVHFKVPEKVVGELDGDGVMRANEIAFSHHHAQDVLDNAIHIPDHHIANSVKKVGDVIILSADKGYDVLLTNCSIKNAKQVKPVLRPSSQQKASENIEYLVTNYAMKTTRIHADYFSMERTADGMKDSITSASSSLSTQTKLITHLSIINEEGEAYQFSRKTFISQEIERNYLDINRAYLSNEAQEAMGQNMPEEIHVFSWDSSHMTELSDSLLLSMPVSDLIDVATGIQTLPPLSPRSASPDSVHSLGSDLSDWSSETDASSVRSDSPVMVEHHDAESESLSRPATPDSARSLNSDDWSELSDLEHSGSDSEFVFLSPQELTDSLSLQMSDSRVDIDYDLTGLDIMGASNIAAVKNVDYNLTGLDVMGAANIAEAAPVRFNAPMTQKVKVKMSFNRPLSAKIITEKGELIEYPEEAADDIDKVIIES